MRSELVVNLGDVEFDGLKSDADFERIAEQMLPHVLKGLDDELGRKAWDKMQREFSGTAIKLNKSSIDRQKFVSESARQYQQTADRRWAKDVIIEQLREQKADRERQNDG